jgi:hypothetical protein
MEGLNFIKNKSENTKIVIYHVVIMQCLFIIMSGSIWQESTIVIEVVQTFTFFIEVVQTFTFFIEVIQTFTFFIEVVQTFTFFIGGIRTHNVSGDRH